MDSTLPVVDAEGDILLCAVNSSTNSGTIKMIRLKPDGSLDTSFGTSGIQSGGGGYTAAGSVLDASGRLIITSYYRDGGGYLLPFLERFNTAAPAQRLYVEQDADYNVTSITNSSGTVVERYTYDPYGNVTVLNADGTTRGDGTAGSSEFNEVYLYQGMRYSVATGTYATETRVYSPTLGRPLTEDPDHYIDGTNMGQWEEGNPINRTDPDGETPTDDQIQRLDDEISALQEQLWDLKKLGVPDDAPIVVALNSAIAKRYRDMDKLLSSKKPKPLPNLENPENNRTVDCPSPKIPETTVPSTPNVPPSPNTAPQIPANPPGNPPQTTPTVPTTPRVPPIIIETPPSPAPGTAPAAPGFFQRLVPFLEGTPLPLFPVIPIIPGQFSGPWHPHFYDPSDNA